MLRTFNARIITDARVHDTVSILSPLTGNITGSSLVVAASRCSLVLPYVICLHLLRNCREPVGTKKINPETRVQSPESRPRLVACGRQGGNWYAQTQNLAPKSNRKMAGSSNPSPGPKILLAKPGVVSTGAIAGKFGRGEDETAAHAPPHPLRSRLPSLNLLSDSWDFNIDRFLPFLSENTEFTVVGVIGPPGMGKSTIMNELYGFDATSPGMLPPFSILSEDTKALGKHCTSGIEPRISPQRLLLLDTQPVFSSSILAEMMRSDGSSTIPLLSGGESLSAELVLELLGIQLGVLLASICHILLVVSDGVHDNNMWRFMLTVDLLKHGIPDPSSLTSSNSSLGSEREKKSKAANEGEEYIATPVFVHTKLEDRNCTPRTYNQLSNALAQYLGASSFVRDNCRNVTKEPVESGSNGSNMNSTMAPRLFMVPSKSRDDCAIAQYESYISGLGKLRDQVLSMDCPSFARTVSERDWLKNSAKIWELIKGSPVITEYSRMLQSSGMFKK